MVRRVIFEAVCNWEEDFVEVEFGIGDGSWGSNLPEKVGRGRDECDFVGRRLVHGFKLGDGVTEEVMCNTDAREIATDDDNVVRIGRGHSVMQR